MLHRYFIVFIIWYSVTVKYCSYMQLKSIREFESLVVRVLMEKREKTSRQLGRQGPGTCDRSGSHGVMKWFLFLFFLQGKPCSGRKMPRTNEIYFVSYTRQIVWSVLMCSLCLFALLQFRVCMLQTVMINSQFSTHSKHGNFKKFLRFPTGLAGQDESGMHYEQPAFARTQRRILCGLM